MENVARLWRAFLVPPRNLRAKSSFVLLVVVVNLKRPGM